MGRRRPEDPPAQQTPSKRTRSSLRGRFVWALERGYDIIGQMDADGSHDPGDLPHLVDSLAQADLVIGSRYVPGGSTAGWSAPRRIFSRAANGYARRMLNVPVHGVTGGFKVWRAPILAKAVRSSRTATNNLFLLDNTMSAVRAGARITEVPITFHERMAGNSKVSSGAVAEALVGTWKLRFRSPPTSTVVLPLPAAPAVGP